MDEVITLDLGYFLRYITAYLDTDATVYFTTDGGEVYTPVVLDGKYRIFGKTNLTRLLRVINSTFFKAYGGWRIGLYFNPCGIFTGEANFTPADLHQQLPTLGDVP